MLKGVGDPFADWRDVTYVGSLEDENGTGGTMSGIQVPPPLMPFQLTRSLTSVTDGQCSRMHALTQAQAQTQIQMRVCMCMSVCRSLLLTLSNIPFNPPLVPHSQS